jgi:molybdenum cofactor cytidylyltransferase
MICALVLAAGQSRRMGTNKLLLPYGSTTVIGHIVETVLKSNIDGVYVVTGGGGDRVADTLSGLPISILDNPDCEMGMLSSVRYGLRALPPESSAAMVVLGDQPGITSEVINCLIQSFDESNKGIIVPAYEGRRGHPILFSIRYKEEILTRYDETGLRGLIHAHEQDVLEVCITEAAVLRDMDRIEDYHRELGHREKGQGQ